VISSENQLSLQPFALVRARKRRRFATFILVTDRASWVDVEPPEKKLEEALMEAYGDGGPQILDQLRHSCHRIVTELSVFRPDLSHMPK
jgi:hypothetical protein